MKIVSVDIENPLHSCKGFCYDIGNVWSKWISAPKFAGLRERRGNNMALLECFYPDLYLDSTYEIDFDALPDRFVLKCNHNSGLGMCICKEKAKLDVGEVRKELRRGLNEDYYIRHREWPYKNVPRKIICEQ